MPVSPYTTNERIVGPDERFVTVKEQVAIDDRFVDEVVFDRRPAGIRRQSVERAARELFPSGWAVGIEWVGKARAA